MLRVQTIGAASNRDGIGARVDVAVRGGASLWQIVKTGSSYASQSELPLTFGLGGATGVDAVQGHLAERARRLGRRAQGESVVTIKEGTGVVSAAPINRALIYAQSTHEGRRVRVLCVLCVLGVLCVAACRGQTPPPAAARERAYRANNRGVALLEQFKYPEAAAAFREALASTRRSPSRT